MGEGSQEETYGKCVHVCSKYLKLVCNELERLLSGHVAEIFHFTSFLGQERGQLLHEERSICKLTLNNPFDTLQNSNFLVVSIHILQSG